MCEEATKGTALVGHTHYVEIDDYLIDAAKFAVEQCNKKADREVVFFFVSLFGLLEMYSNRLHVECIAHNCTNIIFYCCVLYCIVVSSGQKTFEV